MKSVENYLEKIRANRLSLFMNPCTTYEIKRLIEKLPSKTSSGHNNVSNLLLKEICEPLLPILDYIVNESLKLGQFPTIMKLAEVVALFKSGKSEILGNYRPISLLMTISKILEKVVYNRVYKFLNDTRQIYECQFRSAHYHEKLIGQLIGYVIKNLEQKKDTISVFVELSKAFDTLQHDIILQKMEKYGLCGVTLSWFQSYLENRKLRAKCQTAQSGKVINLIPTLLSMEPHKGWFNANKLTLNLSKTVYLFFE